MAGSAEVAVVGAGPAGLATAIALARRGRRVTVVERGPRAAAKAGETFGPRLRPLLEGLGAWADFAALATLPFRGVRSAWGSSRLADRPSIQHPLGEGWHVDRARFEDMLAAVAGRTGAELRWEAGACSVRRDGDGFRILDRDRRPLLTARCLVDASGRGAPASAGLAAERRWLSLDRQVGVVLAAPLAGPAGPELLLESCEEGWWYAVPQPGGTLRCVLLTDADLLPAGPRSTLRGWAETVLHGAPHTSRLAANAGPFDAAEVVRADSGFLVPDRGPGWWAVGDAARSGDPLAGDGLERALEGALRTAERIDRSLAGATPGPAEDSAPAIAAYLRTRGRYYAQERRWPDSLYWRRRQPAEVERAGLWLAPERTLRRAGPRPDAAALARAEALVPRKALAEVVESLAEPRPAHVVLTALRAAAPLEDLNLLVALQLLVEDGALVAG